MPTWIIDPAGTGDYTTIAAAVAAIPSSLSEPYTLRLRSTSEFVVGSISIASRTMNGHAITFEPAPGFGFADHPNAASNPLRYNPAVGIAVRGNDQWASVFSVDCDNVVFRGLQIRYDGTGSWRSAVNMASTGRQNLLVEGCILDSTVTANSDVLRVSSGVVRNTLIVSRLTNAPPVVANAVFSGTSLQNCTIVTPSGVSSSAPAIARDWGGSSNVIRNCAIIGGFSACVDGSGVWTGSHNATNLAAVGFGASNLTSLSAADQFENISTGSQDWRTRSGNALTGAGTATGAPAADIILRPRPATPEIGVWDAPGSGGGAAPRVIGGIVTLD
jgi:hypothetical protein